MVYEQCMTYLTMTNMTNMTNTSLLPCLIKGLEQTRAVLSI